MGVRGLTTFISQRADQYMECINLSNCFLVIDGNSLAAQIYNHTPNTNCCFGGDYDKYAACILEFFRMLRACSIKPLVVFDGGYERLKLLTVDFRFKDRIRGAMHQNPAVRTKHYPLLLKLVMTDILNDLEIPFAQSLFEADEEIAAIARNLNCPVLSYDSDFFIYDVDYIPFTTIEWRVHEDYPLQGPYLKCSRFKVDSFLLHYGLKKEMLPFLAVVLGNDYISRSVFKNFVTHLKRIKSKKKNKTEKNISGLLVWLRHETLQSAITKVTDTLPKEKRKGVMRKMNDIIALYKHCSSDLLPHLGICKDASTDISSENGLNVMSVFDSKQTDEASESEEEGGIGDEASEVFQNGEEVAEAGVEVRKNSPWHKRTALKLPDWFLNCYRAGSLPSVFMDMVTLNVYFISPQVEEVGLDCSHIASFPVIQVLYGLLCTSGLMRGSPLVCNIRGQRSVRKVNIRPLFTAGNCEFPKLEHLHDLPMEVRKDILRDVLGINVDEYEDLQSVPPEWLLFAMVVIYWIRNSRVGVNSCHVLVLTICFLTLSVIDQRGSYEGENSDNSLNEVDTSDDDHCASGGSAIGSKGQSSEVESVEQRSSIKKNIEALATLSAREFLLLSKAMSEFHKLDKKLQASPKAFSASIAHVFAEFQSCLLHIRYLNALLGLPFLKCSPYRVFNGTLTYNLYNRLKKKTDPVAYIDQLFSFSPHFLCLLKSLFDLFCNLLPALRSVDMKTGQKRKKRKKGSQSNQECDDMDNLYEILRFIEG